MTPKKNAVNINTSPAYPKISDTLGAYFGLIENWDENKIDTVKEMKTLALNDNGDVICEISFPLHPETALKNILESLKVAKSKHATKVILGQNQPFKHPFPNSKEKALARKFIACAKELDMRIEDQLMLSENSYYSFAKNGIS